MSKPAEFNCSTKNFKALTVTQFLGALNDNIYKLAVSLLALKLLVTQTGGTFFLSLGGALFVLPFILFSPYAGYLADRFSKVTVIRAVKIFEMIIMSIAVIGLAGENMPLLFTALFLLGTHSAFFSPAKYGILPEILDDKNLSKGNGYVQFWTFMAIIVGTAVGGQMMTFWGERLINVGLAVFVIAAGGFVSSLFLSNTEAFGNKRKFEINGFKDVARSLREIKKDNNLFLALVAAAYFWFVGAFFQMNVLLYSRQLLLVGEQGTSLILFCLALGLGLGSILAGFVSEGKVELGLVPIGGIGLSVFSFALGIWHESLAVSSFLVFALGLCGGFFIVPLNAYIQKQSPNGSRGRFLAAANFVSNIAMIFASVTLWIFKDHLGLNAAHLFTLMGIFSAAAAVFIFKKLPIAFLRCLNWLLTHTLYKTKILNKENVPQQGGALLVCNHVSYMDPPLVLASNERPIRFMMFRELYESKLLHPVAKAMKAIPVSFKDRPRDIIKSLEEARKAIQDGELVCIFAEGGLTRIGQMLPFKKGFERIMQGLEAPIIPVHIDQIWGSIFSFKNGKYFWKFPEELPYPITISFGKPLPSSSTAYQVREAVQELGSCAFNHRKDVHKQLHIGFLKQSKRHPFRSAMADSIGVKLNYLQALTGSLSLSKIFKSKIKGSKMVGVLLPTSAVGALTNLALLIAGFIPVNLNFTASKESVESAKKQCGMKDVVTSKKFLEKIQWEPESGTIFIEDLMKNQTGLSKVVWLLKAFLLPDFLIEKIYFEKGISSDDVATVIFSSGSTGEPKGVMLTHSNIASNVEAVYDIFQMKSGDAVVGVLPFFHSFGFTGTLWLPLLSGIKAVYHSNPLDAGVIGKIVKEHHGTVLLSTPTFLQAYIRKCTPEQFKTLHHVIVGAEKLKDRIAEAFKEKFGIIPFEGYGATELSPFATLNINDYREEGIKQTGQKLGKIGHPIPGVAVKVVDPDSGRELPSGQDGLLLIKGPNVMKGYLNQPEKTSEVIKNGWYYTGDIANIDDDGFITITDRMSRFSKIGGEMVPHIKVEEAIHEALNEAEQICAVTTVAEEKKGEKLVVLHTKPFVVSELRKKLTEMELPALWIPKSEDFYLIETLPILGSGKLDLKSLKNMAKSFSEKANG